MGSVEDSDTLGLYHMPIYPCKHGTLSPALMLGQRCRQWANIKWTLRQRRVCGVSQLHADKTASRYIGLLTTCDDGADDCACASHATHGRGDNAVLLSCDFCDTAHQWFYGSITARDHGIQKTVCWLLRLLRWSSFKTTLAKLLQSL